MNFILETKSGQHHLSFFNSSNLSTICTPNQNLTPWKNKKCWI